MFCFNAAVPTVPISLARASIALYLQDADVGLRAKMAPDELDDGLPDRAGPLGAVSLPMNRPMAPEIAVRHASFS